MDDWCDDFQIKAGDTFPVNSAKENRNDIPQLPSIPTHSMLDTSWNVPDWTSNPVCQDPWLTDSKVRFAPVVETLDEKTYPQPSDDTGDALDYIPPNTYEIPHKTLYHNSGISDQGFTQQLSYSVGCESNYSGNNILYLNVLDIFKYVTLGGVISDEYVDSFCTYVYNSDSDFKNRKTCRHTYTSVAGHTFSRSMVMYQRTDYLKLVELCANWANSNPEKVIMTQIS